MSDPSPTPPPPEPPPVTSPKLVVLLPVHNEVDVVARVAREWLAVLDDLQVPYRLQFRNDGSTDGTQEALEHLRHPCLEIHSARNRGHGPTILRGYKAAMERAPWVFQTDSDGELPAQTFPEFWAAREKADLVVGFRTGRSASWPRRALSAGARSLVALLFGRGLRDVNCPYRLMRSSAFFRLMDRLPEDTFAPNVILSGYSRRSRLRVVEKPVPFTPRQSGKDSLPTARLFRVALACTRQLLAFRFRRENSPAP